LGRKGGFANRSASPSGSVIVKFFCCCFCVVWKHFPPRPPSVNDPATKDVQLGTSFANPQSSKFRVATSLYRTISSVCVCDSVRVVVPFVRSVYVIGIKAAEIMYDGSGRPSTGGAATPWPTRPATTRRTGARQRTVPAGGLLLWLGLLTMFVKGKCCWDGNR
uniref:Uncharacterized protein n=1 Tax=Anopheles coluzzii TaxID=1518534 RepID=A0A8W7PLL8_ANOCL